MEREPKVVESRRCGIVSIVNWIHSILYSNPGGGVGAEAFPTACGLLFSRNVACK